MIILQVAATVFAGISAVASAIDTWRATRKDKAAAAAFDQTFAKMRESSESKMAAEELVAVIPEDVIRMLEARADRCWTGYRKTLDGGFLPDEIDEATESVQECVCRELRRLHTLSGSIPDRWQGQWKRFKCAGRERELPFRETAVPQTHTDQPTVPHARTVGMSKQQPLRRHAHH